MRCLCGTGGRGHSGAQLARPAPLHLRCCMATCHDALPTCILPNVQVMCVDYGFRSGFGRINQGGDGEIPKNILGLVRAQSIAHPVACTLPAVHMRLMIMVQPEEARVIACLFEVVMWRRHLVMQAHARLMTGWAAGH